MHKVNYLYPYGIIFLDMTIGEYIKEKRKQFKLTQIELAERSGVGVRFVRELERGKTTVRVLCCPCMQLDRKPNRTASGV